MGKVRKGYDSQNGVISKFRKDARSKEVNAAWQQCKGSAKRVERVEKPRFTGKPI